MNKKFKKYFLITIIILFLLTSLFQKIFNNNINDDMELKNDNNLNSTQNLLLDKEEKNEKEIVVHLSGQVNKPGVYRINNDKRLADLLKIAGGVKENADMSDINLAVPLIDGEKIIIPEKISSSSELEFIEVQSVENNSSIKSSELININSADLDELQEISGIGPSKAEAIIDFRNENGFIDDKSSLTKISGIGEKTVEKIEDEICLK